MTHTPEEDDLLAAEYVLGVLSLPDRIAAAPYAAAEKMIRRALPTRFDLT